MQEELYNEEQRLDDEARVFRNLRSQYDNRWRFVEEQARSEIASTCRIAQERTKNHEEQFI
eukprot:1593583-Amphidinium_carterae.1